MSEVDGGLCIDEVKFHAIFSMKKNFGSEDDQGNFARL